MRIFASAKASLVLFNKRVNTEAAVSIVVLKDSQISQKSISDRGALNLSNKYE